MDQETADVAEGQLTPTQESFNRSSKSVEIPDSLNLSNEVDVKPANDMICSEITHNDEIAANNEGAQAASKAEIGDRGATKTQYCHPPQTIVASVPHSEDQVVDNVEYLKADVYDPSATGSYHKAPDSSDCTIPRRPTDEEINASTVNYGWPDDPMLSPRWFTDTPPSPKFDSEGLRILKPYLSTRELKKDFEKLHPKLQILLRCNDKPHWSYIAEWFRKLDADRDLDDEVMGMLRRSLFKLTDDMSMRHWDEAVEYFERVRNTAAAEQAQQREGTKATITEEKRSV